MPEMNGYEATKRIKSHPLGKQTIIIALTASAFEEERQTILAAGCDDFLRKPFEAKILFAKMESLLGLRYVYEEPVELNAEKTTEINEVFSNQSVESQLCKMSPQWLQDISDAASQCCDDKILQLIEEMPLELDLVAQNLSNLANDFLFDEIVTLVKPLLSVRSEN